jgi:hypothetical protein
VAQDQRTRARRTCGAGATFVNGKLVEGHDDEKDAA